LIYAILGQLFRAMLGAKKKQKTQPQIENCVRRTRERMKKRQQVLGHSKKNRTFPAPGIQPLFRLLLCYVLMIYYFTEWKKRHTITTITSQPNSLFSICQFISNVQNDPVTNCVSQVWALSNVLRLH